MSVFNDNDALIAQMRSEIEFLRNDHARLLTELEAQRVRLTAERDAATVECDRLRLAAFPLTSAAGVAYARNAQKDKGFSAPNVEPSSAPSKLKRLSWQEVQDKWVIQQEQELEEQRKEAEAHKAQEN